MGFPPVVVSGAPPFPSPQAALGGLPVEEWSLKADVLKLFSALPRILKVVANEAGGGVE